MHLSIRCTQGDRKRIWSTDRLWGWIPYWKSLTEAYGQKAIQGTFVSVLPPYDKELQTLSASKITNIDELIDQTVATATGAQAA